MKYEFLIQPRPESNLNSFLKNTVHCAKNIFMHILEIKIKRRLLMYVYKSNYSEY